MKVGCTPVIFTDKRVLSRKLPKKVVLGGFSLSINLCFFIGVVSQKFLTEGSPVIYGEKWIRPRKPKGKGVLGTYSPEI